MKIFVAVFFAILAAAGVIYFVYAIPRDIGAANEATRKLHNSVARSDALLRAYSTPSSSPREQAKTLSGATAVIITTPVRVNIPRGEVIVPKGTRMKLVAEKGEMLLVDYDGYSVPIPANCASRFAK